LRGNAASGVTAEGADHIGEAWIVVSRLDARQPVRHYCVNKGRRRLSDCPRCTPPRVRCGWQDPSTPSDAALGTAQRLATESRPLCLAPWWSAQAGVRRWRGCRPGLSERDGREAEQAPRGYRLHRPAVECAEASFRGDAPWFGADASDMPQITSWAVIFFGTRGREAPQFQRLFLSAVSMPSH
jgi:hypothetical protein